MTERFAESVTSQKKVLRRAQFQLCEYRENPSQRMLPIASLNKGLFGNSKSLRLLTEKAQETTKEFVKQQKKMEIYF